jgi:hypothetical protein
MYPAKQLWNRLDGGRTSYVDRARRCAELTLPFTYPPDGAGPVTALPTPYNSLGARGVNNLAAKLLLSLLPPNTPFFRFTLNRETVRQAQATQLLNELDYAFSEMEKEMMDEIEGMRLRPVLYEAMRHLLISGNGLLELTPKGKWKFRGLESFVVERDSSDNLLTLVTKECVSTDALPQDLKDAVYMEHGDGEREVDVFTVVQRGESGGFDSWQEVCGKEVDGSRTSYKEEDLPYIILRWNRVSGEDYGRGLVEEYLGDLMSLESLTRSIVEASLAASRMLFLVNPNGLTSARTLQDAPNGAIRDGVAEDVSVLQVEKYQDFRVALETMNGIKERIGFAFLLNTSVQRPGERVTATEIRAMISELEASLGGVFATLSEELSLPLVNLVLTSMLKRKKLRKLPKGIVRPIIVTGLDALGRGQDLQKLDFFLAGIRDSLGPQAIAQYLDVQGYLTRRASSLGLDLNGLVKSQEQLQAEQQQMQQMAMMEKLGPSVVQGGAKLMSQGMDQQGQGAMVNA